MAKIQEKCPTCGAVAEEDQNFLGMISLKCGHFIAEGQKLEPLHVDVYGSLTSTRGHKLRGYQSEDCNFLDKSANGRGLLDWEMGLGKMIAICAWLAAHKNDPGIFPVVIVGKASTLLQWEQKLLEWSNEDEKFIPFIFRSGKAKVSSYFQIYLTTYDLVPKLLPGFVGLKNQPKTLILDECQAIKNHSSKRTNSVRLLAQLKTSEKDHSEGEIPNIIGTSGSAILNNMLEFFPLLNILYPRQFPDLKRFALQYTTSYIDQVTRQLKPGGLAKWAEREWEAKTSKFIVHRTRKQVAPEIPAVDRQFQVYQLSEEVEKEYKKVLISFNEKMQQGGGEVTAKTGMDILSFIGQMRHIVGRAKARAISDYVEEFLESTDEQIVIAYYHKDVGEILEETLKGILVSRDQGEYLFRISDKDTFEEKHRKVQTFGKDKKNRIGIIRLLAEGEGVDGLQCASTTLVTERWWNAKKEEQFESRLARIGSTAQKIVAMYPIVVGTIDEWNAELNEQKRNIADSVLEGVSLETYEKEHDLTTSESSNFKEIAKMMYAETKTSWSLSSAMNKAELALDEI